VVFRGGWRARFRRIVRVATYWNAAALDVGDIVRLLSAGPESGLRVWNDSAGLWWDELDAQRWNAGSAELAEVWSGLSFRVFEIEIDSATNAQVIGAIEE
jgi:hypothetical protein